MSDPTRDVRRRSLPWDRLKILLLLVTVGAIIWATKVNEPFVTSGDALREMWGETFGRILLILIPLELLRQAHYWISERSERYNRFWSDRFFGGFERQTEKRLSPWTRFRLGRYAKIVIFVFLYGVILNLLADSVDTPWEAITQSPKLAADALPQILIFVFYMFFVVAQFILLFWFLSRGGVDVVMP